MPKRFTNKLNFIRGISAPFNIENLTAFPTYAVEEGDIILVNNFWYRFNGTTYVPIGTPLLLPIVTISNETELTNFLGNPTPLIGILISDITLDLSTPHNYVVTSYKELHGNNHIIQFNFPPSGTFNFTLGSNTNIYTVNPLLTINDTIFYFLNNNGNPSPQKINLLSVIFNNCEFRLDAGSTIDLTLDNVGANTHVGVLFNRLLFTIGDGLSKLTIGGAGGTFRMFGNNLVKSGGGAIVFEQQSEAILTNSSIGDVALITANPNIIAGNFKMIGGNCAGVLIHHGNEFNPHDFIDVYFPTGMAMLDNRASKFSHCFFMNAITMLPSASTDSIVFNIFDNCTFGQAGLSSSFTWQILNSTASPNNVRANKIIGGFMTQLPPLGPDNDDFILVGVDTW